MTPIWTKEHGWSRKPGPYFQHCVMMAVVLYVIKVVGGDELLLRPGGAFAFFALFVLLALGAWGVVRLRDRLFGRRGRRST